MRTAVCCEVLTCSTVSSSSSSASFFPAASSTGEFSALDSVTAKTPFRDKHKDTLTLRVLNPVQLASSAKTT